ncbi:hypothetical protein CTA2_11660 [Colletotrichum tanaceti]|uniref:Uncharacterized protein n=1 Tax=Colletotrichum tanaceti TaxID=1306861 RepID=A0A4V6DHX2_9PEZI|nr:hypothetical protein CTA2_11661 [Colletotrichum tanaceti]KAJ0167970.1 hypothetical protein CTA2_11660 [Colletotrichum tanaceti]TKW58256.1 hypothetical protein CTA1_12103 [Colletotrichum tanaceti]
MSQDTHTPTPTQSHNHQDNDVEHPQVPYACPLIGKIFPTLEAAEEALVASCHNDGFNIRIYRKGLQPPTQRLPYLSVRKGRVETQHANE